jgi:hypothetical protein
MIAHRLSGPVIGMLLALSIVCQPVSAGPPGIFDPGASDSIASNPQARDAASPDPNWPCQQIKVPRLSLAAIWSGPMPEQQGDDWRTDQAVAALVRQTAQRRMPIEQARNAIHDFARASQDRQQKLLELLAGLFGVLDDECAATIEGLDRFGARQRQLAASLREDNAKLGALRADPSSDAGEVSQMTQKVMWNAEVFQDRRRSLSYACEVPGKIEQRLFALARAIQSELP